MSHRAPAVEQSKDHAEGTSPNLKRAAIERLAADKIRGFRGTIGDNGQYLDEVYKSNASLTANVASDYRDRFLIELIQNAYDAHSVQTRDGQIEITLDMREEIEGTLFVANTGRAFTADNVKDLCNIGLSRKPLGESIGNKGLGFRSVVQITDTPRIYSQQSDAPRQDHFSGFCFGFAGVEEYQTLIDDPRHRELAGRDLPIFHIPVWLERQSDTVRAYCGKNHSTLIELPLRNAAAQDAVRREIEDLRAQQVPMLLFLDRVQSLKFRIVNAVGETETEFAFTRSEETKEFSDISLSRVNLDAAGIFLVARRAVAERTMQEAISEAITRKELNDHWERWTGAGDIAIAVRLDALVKTSRLYTYLPMGEQAAAPFQGYLHGSFFPSSNRKHLSARNRLNAVLLEEAVGLVAEAVFQIAADPSGRISSWLTHDERAGAVSDFMCWEKVGSLEADEDLAEAVAFKIAKIFGCDDFDDAPVVPCAQSGSVGVALTWKPPKFARLWPAGNGIFSADEASRLAQSLGIWPIWHALDARQERLDDYLLSHSKNYVGGPSGEERAQLVGQMAEELQKNRRTTKSSWQEYFEEIPVFMGSDGNLLSGLPVLVGDDGELHVAMSPPTDAVGSSRSSRRRRHTTTAIFSPPDPRRTDTDDDLQVDPPKKLSERFGFLSTAFAWHGELSDARAYFEKHKLVEVFDREAILAQLSRILRNERNKEVLKGGLRWAFQLWRQPRATNRSFRLQAQHRFRVPTIDGRYIEAREAVFSAGWPSHTSGGLLQEFLDAAPPGTSDLEALASRRLAAPDHLAFRNRLVDDWVEFMSELGVGRGIGPERKVSKKKQFLANQISDFSFLKDYGLPEVYGDLWQEDIKSSDPSLLTLPSTTEYVIQGEIHWLPGQADVESFSPVCKTLYARLILSWLMTPPNVPWELVVHHNYSYRADRRKWPTPIAAFLRSARWLPVDDFRHSDNGPVSATPSEVWLNDTDGERFLPYLPRPVRELRLLLERGGNDLIQNLRERAGLRILGNPDTLADQLAFIAYHFGTEGFDDHFRPRLLNLYYRTWRQFLAIVEDGPQDPEETEVPVAMLVQKHQSIVALNMFDEEDEPCEIVYVCDTDRESDAGLLAASGQAFFHLKESEPGRTGELLELFYGERIRRMSHVDYTLRADGNIIDDVEKMPILEVCPHLRRMLAVAIEALIGTEAQRLPSDRSELLAKLDRISLAKASALSFVVDGISISPEQIASQAFNLTTEDGHSVVLVGSGGNWSWDLVDRCLPAICEALGQRALSPHLRLLLAHISRDVPLIDTQAHPGMDVGRMAELLQLPASSTAAASATLNAGLERQAPWIRAVLYHFEGSVAVDAFDKEFDNIIKDEGLLRTTLSKLLPEMYLDVGELLAVCRNALGPGDFREGLNLDFADFNKSLTAIGLEAETYPEQHRWCLENFLRQRELEITECLLLAYSEKLKLMLPADGYAAARDAIRTLKPDPDWLLLFKEPPDVMLEALVNTWLEEQGAPSLGDQFGEPSNLAQVRGHNRKFIFDFIKKARPILRAWCAKFQPDRSVASLINADGAEDLAKRLDSIGVLDFRMLDENSAAKWLQILDIWPFDMPHSLELKVLGLSDEDVKDESVKAREAREERKREARMVAFNGKMLDPTEIDLFALSDELQQSLSAEVLGCALGSSADLATVERDDHSSKPPRERSAGKKKGKQPRVPEEKTELIGRLGEMVVYHWLKRILSKQDIDSAWVSENGALITGRDGNDGLGYDFEVSYRNQIWQIEVKASVDDPQSFEIGETEVRAARLAARSRSGIQYKIAYVSHVAEPAQTKIEMLPNPMTDEGAHVLELRGEGIRYGFERK